MENNLWVVITFNEYFNIPINTFNDDDISIQPHPIFSPHDNISKQWPPVFSPPDSGILYNPSIMLKNTMKKKNYNDIKLMGIYTSKENAELAIKNFIIKEPILKTQIRLLGPTQISHD